VGKNDPSCVLRIGLETRAISVSPDGTLVSLAFGGLRPRIEVYDIRRSPRLVWQALLPKNSGGAVETAFSSDGEWVTALSGKGVMHRFSARSGGAHLAVPSSGLTASAVPPGRIMAVAGKSGEVTLWYLADGTIDRRIPPRDTRGAIDRVTASGNGEVIATLEYSQQKSVVRVWAGRSRTLLRQIEIDGRTAVSIALDETGKTLFVSHEDKGLLSLSIRDKDGLLPVKGDAAARCKARIQWNAGMKRLVCSVKDGLLLLDDQGAMQRFLPIKNESSDWVASGGGFIIAAAGGGQLLLWRTN
jgi:WD40 repeat protein